MWQLTPVYLMSLVHTYVRTCTYSSRTEWLLVFPTSRNNIRRSILIRFFTNAHASMLLSLDFCTCLANKCHLFKTLGKIQDASMPWEFCEECKLVYWRRRIWRMDKMYGGQTLRTLSARWELIARSQRFSYRAYLIVCLVRLGDTKVQMSILDTLEVVRYSALLRLLHLYL